MKQIGKISHASFGFGGYQDAMFGVSFTLTGKGWGVGDFVGTWAERPERAQWTVEQQREQFAAAVEKIRDLLTVAKKTKFEQLIGVPVEVTFDAPIGGKLVSWRILDEVL